MKRVISLTYNILRTTGVSFALVSMLLGSVLVAYRPAEAATLTSVSDLLSESAPASRSNHTITFTVQSSMSAGEKIVLDFNDNFDIGTIAVGDIDIGVPADTTLVVAAPGDAEIQVASSAGSIISFTLGTNIGIGANSAITIKIGKNASGGQNRILNPATSNTSYSLYIRTTAAGDVLKDDATTYLAIVPTVELTAEIRAAFSFIVDGMDTGSAIDSQTVASASTASRANFGVLTPGTPVMMGTSLSMTSNAEGFVVTVEQNHNLLASSGADIDSFKDGAFTYSPTTWASPLGTLGNENTYGHLGITTEDDYAINKTASVTSTTNGHWIGLDGGMPRPVWFRQTAADGVTQDIGHIDVGYRVQIAAMQEVGRYENRMMYVATPIFGGQVGYLKKAPTIICNNSLGPYNIGPGGTVTLPGTDAVSYYSCTNTSSLYCGTVNWFRYEFYGTNQRVGAATPASLNLTATCANVGIQTVNVWACGQTNCDYCVTTATITDTGNICP
jgi:hypothetical protein